MNHKQIANLVASVIQTDRNEKVRAIRLYVEKTSGVKVSESTVDELTEAMATAMDGTQETLIKQDLLVDLEDMATKSKD